MDQTGPEQTEEDRNRQNRPNWTKINQTEIDQGRPKWTKQTKINQVEQR